MKVVQSREFTQEDENVLDHGSANYQQSKANGTMFRLHFLGSVEVDEEGGRKKRKRLKKNMVEVAVTKIKVCRRLYLLFVVVFQNFSSHDSVTTLLGLPHCIQFQRYPYNTSFRSYGHGYDFTLIIIY